MDKKYSLALGWWAARWLAHIWVIKYLEEKNIEIIEISWTSMWAIIWSLYAFWKSSSDIEKIAKDLNIFKLIDFWLNFWFIKGKKIIEKLEEIFWNTLIEDLKIPLKIVATNLENWEKKVFTSGKIVNAIRASVSLPWVMKPFEIDWVDYIDWWITNNLPVDVLTWENIIWVSALKEIFWPINKKKFFLWFSFNKSFIKYNYEVLHRTILLMMKQNEDKSIYNCNKNAIIIKPNFWDLDYYSFDKVNDFIKLWYNTTKEKLR
jgi:NTE family protein